MTLWQIVLLGVFILLAFSAQLWLAVTIIRRREPISVIKSMNEEIASMAVRLKENQEAQQKSHQQILALEKTVATLESLAGELDRGVKILIKQLEQLNQTPNYMGSSIALVDVISEAASAVLVARDRSQLQSKMVRRFSIEEMYDLSFQLGIEDGQLKDDGTRAGLARAIINHMIRHEQQDLLIQKLEELRPEQQW